MRRKSGIQEGKLIVRRFRSSVLSKGTPATPNASQKSSGTTMRPLGGIHLFVSRKNKRIKCVTVYV